MQAKRGNEKNKRHQLYCSGISLIAWIMALEYLKYILILSHTWEKCTVFQMYWTFFFFTFKMNFILIYSITIVPIFPLLPSSDQLLSLTHSPPSHHCPCPWVIHTSSLTSPFPFFLSVSSSTVPPGHCQSVPCFHVSGSILIISLFCAF